MTPEPDARCVVTRSPVLGTTPSPAAYDIVKISTTAGSTWRVTDCSDALRSSLASAARDGDGAGAWAAARGACGVRLTATTASRMFLGLGLGIGTFLGRSVQGVRVNEASISSVA